MGGLLCGDGTNGGGQVKSKGIVRIIVLGISGSGKSTFSKQMRIIHTKDGFNDDERLTYVGIIRANVLVGIRELSEQASTMGLDVVEQNRKHVRYFKENNIFELDLLDPTILNKVKALWEDSAIQEALEAVRKTQIQVSQLDYLMKRIDVITEPGYVPNNEDIVRGRQRTAGAHTTRFNAFKFNWEIIDVGGQTPERRKWKAIVREGFNAIIFFAALDEYNMESTEEVGKTKMEVSMSVFESVANDEEVFKECNILFLNKMDLFRDKIMTKKGIEDFHKKFPAFKEYMKNGEYKEDGELLNMIPEEYDDKNFRGALAFLKKQFKDLIKSENVILKVFPTCAIQTEQMKTVFYTMKDHIFVKRVEDSGVVF